MNMADGAGESLGPTELAHKSESSLIKLEEDENINATATALTSRPAKRALIDQPKYPGLVSASKRPKISSQLKPSDDEVNDGTYNPDDNVTQSSSAANRARPYAPPKRVTNKKANKATPLKLKLIKTRITRHGGDWYFRVNHKQIWKRSDMNEMVYLITLIQKSVAAFEDGVGLNDAMSAVRNRLHKMEFYDFVTDIVVVKSKLLEDEGLPAIFESKVFPWDVRADSLTLFKKWAAGSFDPDPFRGIITKKGVAANGRKTQSRSLEPNYPFKVSPNYSGQGKLTNGQWWPMQICTIRDGAHGALEGGIHGATGKGAFSIILSSGGYADIDQGDTIQYCGTSGEEGKPTEYTKRMLESCQLKNPVRVLRSSALASEHSLYRPAKGIRYDGLYDVTAFELLDEGTSMYRFTLNRCPDQQPIRYRGEEARPTEQELDQYYKIQATIATAE